MRALACSALLLLPAAGFAAADGGQPLAFTRLAPSARAAALGRAVSALPGEACLQAWNPALVAGLKDLRVGGQAAFLPGGRELQHLSFARPVETGSDWGWGLNFERTGLANIERRSANTPEPEGFFSESGMVAGMATADTFLNGRLAAGCGFKAVNLGLDQANAAGLGLDLGLFFRAWPWLDLGLAAQDVVSRLSWSSGVEEYPPLVLRAAATGWLLEKRVALLAEAEKADRQSARLRAGVEYWPLPGRLALRSGLDDGRFALGFGLRFPLKGTDAGFDYALASDSLEPRTSSTVSPLTSVSACEP